MITNPLEEIIAHGNRAAFNPAATYSERRKNDAPNWLRLGDGTVISVIAGWGTYCSPTPGDSPYDDVPEDYPGPYTHVEAWLPSQSDPRRYRVSYLRGYVTKHGGVVGAYKT